MQMNYEGMLPDHIGVIMGPNTLGEYLVVDDQLYDVHDNRTTLRFKIYRGQDV